MELRPALNKRHVNYQAIKDYIQELLVMVKLSTGISKDVEPQHLTTTITQTRLKYPFKLQLRFSRYSYCTTLPIFSFPI